MRKNDDLISRQDALSFLRNWERVKDYSWGERNIIKATINEIESLPSAQPERKKGKWIMLDKGLIVTSYKCSECGRTVRDDTGYDVSKDYPFCHCGADMREDTK